MQVRPSLKLTPSLIDSKSVHELALVRNDGLFVREQHGLSPNDVKMVMMMNHSSENDTNFDPLSMLLLGRNEPPYTILRRSAHHECTEQAIIFKLVVDEQLELLNAALWRLGVIPHAEAANGHGGVEDHAHSVHLRDVSVISEANAFTEKNAWGISQTFPCVQGASHM